MRRLNVAVTRARESMTLVSSFAHTDIDMTNVREGTGLEFLRNYLQYASTNGTVFAHGEVSNEPMNDFEADIYEALTARGLKLLPPGGLLLISYRLRSLPSLTTWPVRACDRGRWCHLPLELHSKGP
jgi:hypothetical protein